MTRTQVFCSRVLPACSSIIPHITAGDEPINIAASKGAGWDTVISKARWAYESRARQGPQAE
jgi:hypothetical protein